MVWNGLRKPDKRGHDLLVIGYQGDRRNMIQWYTPDAAFPHERADTSAQVRSSSFISWSMLERHLLILTAVHHITLPSSQMVADAIPLLTDVTASLCRYWSSSRPWCLGVSERFRPLQKRKTKLKSADHWTVFFWMISKVWSYQFGRSKHLILSLWKICLQ